MKEPIVALDFGASGLKLVIGYVLNNQPMVLYAATKMLDKAIIHGKIVDREQVVAATKQLIAEASKRTGVKIERVVFALPAFGLEVFETIKETNTVSNNDTVKRNDITNILGMMRKEIVDVNNQIVAVVPEIYTIVDNGNQYDVPPIGEKATTIRMRAKVHTLPKQVVDDYESVLGDAGLSLQKHFVDQYVLARLFENTADVPKKYFLIDIGADVTHVSFVAHKQIYSSRFFHYASHDLNEMLCEKLGVSPAEAEQLKHEYGYDTRILTFNPQIIKVTNQEGATQSYTIEKIREVANTYLESFYQELSMVLATIVKEQKNNPELLKVPFLFTGGGSRLQGLLDFMRTKLPMRTMGLLEADALGARQPTYATALGLIKVYDEYATTIVDEKTYVPPVTRDTGV